MRSSLKIIDYLKKYMCNDLSDLTFSYLNDVPIRKGKCFFSEVRSKTCLPDNICSIILNYANFKMINNKKTLAKLLNKTPVCEEARTACHSSDDKLDMQICVGTQLIHLMTITKLEDMIAYRDKHMRPVDLKKSKVLTNYNIQLIRRRQKSKQFVMDRNNKGKKISEYHATRYIRLMELICREYTRLQTIAVIEYYVKHTNSHFVAEHHRKFWNHTTVV